MNETRLKTRYGGILQGVFAKALSGAGFSYSEDPQYDSTAEVPDFLIPDDRAPEYMLEVHNAGSRDSFRMKIVRTFTAVIESKAFFGKDLISVNVFFGDPRNELPSANLRAMCSFFDLNIFPLETTDEAYRELEEAALLAAGDETVTVRQAVDQVISDNKNGLSELSGILRQLLDDAIINPRLGALWRLEKQRQDGIGNPPKAGGATYFKKGILASIQLDDLTFEILRRADSSVGLPPDVLDKAVRLGLGTVIEELDGDYLDLRKSTRFFFEHPQAAYLRSICKASMESSLEAKSFFADIRDVERREKMVACFLKAVKEGKRAYGDALVTNFFRDDFCGIEHTRCWIADLMPLVMDKSHNYVNGILFQHPNYELGIGNPYPNLVIKSPRLGSDENQLCNFLDLVCDVLWEELQKSGIDILAIGAQSLSSKLLQFRREAVIKLKKLDVMFLVAEGICQNLGLVMSKLQIPTIISDLTGLKSTGRVEAFLIKSSSGQKVMTKLVAVHDGHGDDKSKEWAARRLATYYREENGEILQSELSDGLFVLDGEWQDKDVSRLYKGGWNHICRLDGLENKLKEIFQIHPEKLVGEK